jgi:hypothetical protein
MARTISEIQQSMLDAIAADTVLSTKLTSTSKVSVFRLFTRIIASCAWTVEILFDSLRTEMNELLAKLKPHSLRWYATKALAFQYGYSLAIDSDTYDNSALTEDQIDASLIVKYAAVTEGTDKRLRLKVATQATDLQPLSGAQLAAFSQYMQRIKDAGVKLNIESNDADKLRLKVKVFYDPLILNSQGQRIDGTESEPVQKAIDAFLKSLPFNGVFVLAYLTDALQKVDGVVIPHIVSCETSYGVLPFTSVDVQYVPDAGYLRFQNPADLELEFVPQAQLQ